MKVLNAMTPIIDLNIGANAAAVKAGLETLARDPNDTAQLNKMIADAVCGDYPTFQSLMEFVALCLLQNDPNKLDYAINQFSAVARQTVYKIQGV